MNRLLLTIIMVVTSLLSGCAHQIQLNPNTDAFKVSEKKIDKVVGYHISDKNRNMIVKTPGGGGDDLTYTPYKDTESVLFTVLSNKFKDVYLVKSLEDDTFIKQNEITLIFFPEITTQSSSSSPFTWPPTKFTIDLTVKALDVNGDIVWKKKVSKTGEAEFDEFKSDFSLSARRATEQAFLQLANEIESEISLSN
jgi:hypothetical protein